MAQFNYSQIASSNVCLVCSIEAIYAGRGGLKLRESTVQVGQRIRNVNLPGEDHISIHIPQFSYVNIRCLVGYRWRYQVG